MAFVVEDGTGRSDANAYCEVAFVDAYFADSGGHAGWTAASTSAKQQAIVRATRYIDQRFGRQFHGRKASRTQALEWPRELAGVDDSLHIETSVMPVELKRGCAEYAVRALTGDLVDDPADSRELLEDSKSVGPIATRKRFRSSHRQSAVVANQAFREYPTADLWIEPLLASGSEGSVTRV